MPNIEICGFSTSRANSLKKKIDKIMGEIGLSLEAITSIIRVKSQSCDITKSSQPYLRIYSTNLDEIKEIIVAFKKSGVHEDIEWMILNGFINKYQMKILLDTNI